jgi:cytochrome b561
MFSDRGKGFGVARPLSRYSIVAIVLHWTIALLILANIGLAWTFQTIGPGLTAFKLIQLHKSFGICVLLLSLVRLAWRLFNPPPPLEQPPLLALAAKAAHWSFYGIMIGLPLSGWIMVSTSKLNLPTLLFGVAPWPSIPFLHALPSAAKAVWSAWASNLHLALAWSAYVLIALHVGAALKHQFWDRDAVLDRMAPGLSALTRRAAANAT